MQNLLFWFFFSNLTFVFSLFSHFAYELLPSSLVGPKSTSLFVCVCLVTLFLYLLVASFIARQPEYALAVNLRAIFCSFTLFLFFFLPFSSLHSPLCCDTHTFALSISCLAERKGCQRRKCLRKVCSGRCDIFIKKFLFKFLDHRT